MTTTRSKPTIDQDMKSVLKILSGAVVGAIVVGFVWFIDATNRGFEHHRAVVSQCREAGGDYTEVIYGGKVICWDTKTGRRIFLR